MIDPCAFRMFQPESSLNIPVSTPLKRAEVAELEEEQYMICTPIVMGFCFGTKQWGTRIFLLGITHFYNKLMCFRWIRS
jgi:hypothetical protein